MSLSVVVYIKIHISSFIELSHILFSSPLDVKSFNIGCVHIASPLTSSLPTCSVLSNYY